MSFLGNFFKINNHFYFLNFYLKTTGYALTAKDWL